VVAEDWVVRAVLCGGEGVATASGNGLAPAMAVAPYVELGFGLLGGWSRQRFPAYRGDRGRRGTDGGWWHGGAARRRRRRLGREW
jgi:hypothetical protein